MRHIGISLIRGEHEILGNDASWDDGHAITSDKYECATCGITALSQEDNDNYNYTEQSRSNIVSVVISLKPANK
jgi:hypothetical protein